MKRTLTAGATVALLIGSAVFLSRTSGFQRASGAPRSTLLLTMGEHATSGDKWDGSAEVSPGTVVGVQGWHFAAGDSASGNAWRAAVRVDQVAPFSDPNYTEIRGGERPEPRYFPVGVYVTIEAPPAARIAVQTAQGKFDFALNSISLDPTTFLGGRVSVTRVPSLEKITATDFENDEPAAAILPNGDVAVAWVAYRDRKDRIFLRTRSLSGWTESEEAVAPTDGVFRCALAAAPSGDLFLFWTQRDGDLWNVWTRVRKSGRWQTPERLTTAGSSNFIRAAASSDGSVHIAYQSFRGGQGDIFLRTWKNAAWQPELRVSDSPASDWEPAIAAGPDGTVFIAWDTYDKGNYDICLRTIRGGTPGPVERVTSSPRFQAHASVAVDGQGRPWLAWDESGVNWAKDQGFLIPTPLASPIHAQRSLRIAVKDNGRWMEAADAPREAFPENMRENAEHPHLAFDAQNNLVMMFRHWTRRNSRTIGSPLVWENYLTRYEGSAWTSPQPLASSTGSIEKNPAIARSASGELWAAWMTDNRPFQTAIPQHADVFAGRLELPATGGPVRLKAFAEPFAEAIPSHNNEASDVAGMRKYAISSGGRSYRIYRGDMHRHTDVSQDFKYDGSLLEGYRYAIDAAAFDYIAITDHQAGFDQEFTWWQSQKMTDLFQVAGAFTPLYSYERSVLYPNGHRNVIFAERGVRTLPIPEDELSGKIGAAALYAYLKKNNGITMPHSSATDQGTDWRDHDPDVEPLVEIYQGYRNSYEYEGAPRAATAENRAAQKSGWEPAGFWWNALAKGYKLGVQSSSDHWSTHISYACLLAENFTRAGLLDAIRKRHAYGATDNIVMDFRASAGGAEHLMGEAFSGTAAPRLTVRVIGTNAIKQLDIIKDRKFVYTSRPGTRQANVTFTDMQSGAGESWYYARVLQEDGQLAWSSPVWVTR
jgi:hypothetical protein